MVEFVASERRPEKKTMHLIRFSIVFASATLFCHSLAETTTEKIVAMTPEVECLSAGGHCVHSSKCPAGKVNNDAECPKQKHLGAVCCHSIHAPDETNCEKLAGECKADCPSNLTVAQAQNCPQDEVCCTLV